MSGPLDRLGAIKLKLGALLGGGIVVTAVVLLGGQAAGMPTWLSLAVAVAIALVAVDVLGSGLTAPLRQMARQADRLADGDPVEPVADGARDEVGELARAFNRMAVEVAHTDRVRRELVANVSHELRTPLAALSAVLENLVDGVQQPDAASLGRMQRQVDRLSGLVHQLLDLSQLDAGAVALERVAIPVVRLLEHAVHACGTDAEGRVTLDVVPADLTVALDHDRFGQVLVNLLDNALRHGPAGEPVTVRARAVDGRLALTVTDTGPGISPQDTGRIFQRFGRTDQGRAAHAGGAGLGLAITRWIVELHDGTVRVDDPGTPGASFTVEVPMDADTPDATSRATASDPAPGAGPAAARGGLDLRTPPPVPSTPTTTDVLRLLPTPVAGLRRRSLVAVGVAGTACLAMPLEGVPGVGFALVLLIAAGASVAALEERLDRFGVVCCALAAGVVAQWAVTDAAWLLVPGTLGAVLLAGLGIWGPHRFGEAFRALVVGPLLAFAAPVAVTRGARSQRGAAVGRVVVPLVLSVLVLLVFGGLLSGADALFARVLDAVVPDVRLDETLVLRTVLGALGVVTASTYVLVQRAGAVPVQPWVRSVRPRTDWAVPLALLDLLMVGFLVVQATVLFGGRERVLATTGLTYAEYARSGFFQLVAVAFLLLGVVAAVARVAADEDRRLRDGLLGAAVAMTGVLLVSAMQRLLLYVDAFGMTRLRFVVIVTIGWLAVVLALVVAAALLRRAEPWLPRTLVVLTASVVLGTMLVRPDALIAGINVDRWATTGDIDTAYLATLSADARPTLLRRLPPELAAATSGPCLDIAGEPLSSWNLARSRAHRAVEATSGVQPCDAD